MAEKGAPSQVRQPSRKGKKAWRKNVDVTDIQAGLEDHLQEIIAGGPLSEKTSDEIFALDTSGSVEITKKYNLQKPLRVDRILAERSAVPAVDTRKRAADGTYEPPSKKRKEWVPKADVRRLKSSINQTSHLQDAEEQGAFDVWDTPTEPARGSELEYIPKKQAKVVPPTIKRAPIPLTANGKAVKPVRAPKGEASYNPDFDDWNDAIVKAGDAEVEAEKFRLAEQEREDQRLARIEAAQHEPEMGWRTDEDSAWEGFTDNEGVELKKKRPGRKTPAERNKAKRKKDAERLAKHERNMKQRQSRELAIANGEKDIVAVESEDSDESGDDSKLRRRRMGPMVIPEKNLEVVLPDELQDSLRRLKPEGNLLQDRFRNLLVNGKLESRKANTQPKKRKVKLTEKWAFKDFEVGVH